MEFVFILRANKTDLLKLTDQNVEHDAGQFKYTKER